MRIDRPRYAGVVLSVSLALLAGAAAGCHSSSFQIVSYKDPYFPEHYRTALTDCVYRTDPSGDVHAVGRATRATEQGTTRQYLYIHMFWQPKPGKTPAEQSATDATFRYVVTTNTGATTYAGTGFVFPQQRAGGHLEIAIESARLHLESQRGEVGDVLGDSRLTGTLIARRDPPAAANLIREAELSAAR